MTPRQPLRDNDNDLMRTAKKTDTPRTDEVQRHLEETPWMDGKDYPTLLRELERELAAVTRERDAAVRMRQEAEHAKHDAQIEVERLKRMSTIEMMCENMNVDHHVTEWENRCLKAESEVDRLRSDRNCEKRMRKDAEDTREELRTEVERLRALLQELSDGCCGGVPGCQGCELGKRIRAALGEE